MKYYKLIYGLIYIANIMAGIIHVWNGQIQAAILNFVIAILLK